MPTVAVRSTDISWPSEAPPIASDAALDAGRPLPEAFYKPASPAPDLFPHPANDRIAPAPAKPAARVRKAVVFNRAEALVVTMGAAALGAACGTFVAFLAGAEASLAVAASLWIVFAVALHLAAKTLAQLLRAGAWSQAAIYAVHLFAFAPWPLSVILATPDMGVYWVGLASLLGTLAIFLMSGRPGAGVNGEIVYRVCAHTMLITGVTVLQAMMLAFSH